MNQVEMERLKSHGTCEKNKQAEYSMRNGHVIPQCIGGLAAQVPTRRPCLMSFKQHNFRHNYTLPEWGLEKKKYHKMSKFEGEIGFSNAKKRTNYIRYL